MNIIKTPDKVIIDRKEIERIVAEHIKKETGRQVRVQTSYTPLSVVNGVLSNPNFQLTFELVEDLKTTTTEKGATDEDILEQAKKIAKEPRYPWPFTPPTPRWGDYPGAPCKSPGVVPSPFPFDDKAWPWPISDQPFMSPTSDVNICGMKIIDGKIIKTEA